jgi:hypothetical protein
MNEQTSYTSPHTGRVYDVVAIPQSRVEYREFMNAETRYVHEYTQYSFYYLGALVYFTFDYDENRLSDAFGAIEGLYASLPGSRFD